MTPFILLLGFLVLTIAGLTFGLWRMARLRQGLGGAPVAQLRQIPPRNYSPMGRLFDTRDLQFLKSQPGWRRGMTARLRRERRAVLSLYLHEARADFRRVWSSLRHVAPWSENPEFAFAMLQQMLTFYALYAALRLHCVAGSVLYVRANPGGLLAILQRLHKRTRQVVSRPPADLQAMQR